MTTADLDIWTSISASPNTGLQRVVEVNSFQWVLNSKAVVLNTSCYSMKDGELIHNRETPPFGVPLIANNETRVNAATGAIVDPDPVTGEYPVDVTLVGQYDFMRALASVPVVLSDLILQYVLVADSRGRYND